MKRLFILIAVAMLLLGTSVALILPELPPLPEITEELSPPVNYNFRIQGMKGNEIELAHVNKNQPMFFSLKLAGSWETKRPSLFLTGISEKARMSAGSGKEAQGEKGFGRFMKDNQGKPVRNYMFNNTIVMGKDRKQYMRMLFKGPAMPMVGTLILERKVILPGSTKKNFERKEEITLMPGTYTLDEKNNGFFIEIGG